MVSASFLTAPSSPPFHDIATTRSSSPGTIVGFDATAAAGCIAPIRASSPTVSSMLFWSATSAFGMPGVSTFVATGVTLLQPASPQAMRLAAKSGARDLRTMLVGSHLR
jgi:hypothetical protein